MNALKMWLCGLLLALGVMAGAPAFAGDATTASGSPIARDFPPGLVIPDAARPGPHFDADKATQAYLDLLSPEQRKLSDAYFEGGYWLLLWDFLIGVAVAVLLLVSGISVRMR
ncbi:MAG: hypothetical protein JSS03_08930, partial [Proteobacteria bacterium]|nr:hypothetical protein [Pseudomonadota bacterium]